MIKTILRMGVLTMLITTISCEKMELENNGSKTVIQPELSETDPVIAEFSKYGDIAEAPDNYVTKSDFTSGYYKLYLLQADSGPYAGTEIEIVRFLNESDIPVAEASDFNLKRVEGEVGNISYVYCELPGTNCLEGEINGHCILIFNDTSL